MPRPKPCQTTRNRVLRFRPRYFRRGRGEDIRQIRFLSKHELSNKYSRCRPMSVFVKIRIIHKLQLTKMSEISTLCVLRRHFRQVVKSARAERSRAERYSVMRDGNVVNGGNNVRHSLNLFYVIKRYAVFFAIPAKRQFNNFYFKF